MSTNTVHNRRARRAMERDVAKYQYAELAAMHRHNRDGYLGLRRAAFRRTLSA